MEIKTPTYEYTVELEDPTKEVLVSLRNARASYKKTVELMDAIRGKRVKEAQAILDGIITMRQPIHYTRHRKHVPHHAPLKGSRGAEGGYPVRVAKELQRLLDNGLAAADKKGLDEDKLVVFHCAALMGLKVRRFFARARGQHDLKVRQLIHMELGLKEVS
ncbi:MAG: 50S ribosomal protein L22 [Thermoprotei archaeon]